MSSKIPQGDMAKIEGYAGTMAVRQGISYEKAKEALIKEYKKKYNRAFKSAKFDLDEFQDGMEEYIKHHA